MNISSIQTNFTMLSSGKRINSAADDASGLAISQKLLTQETGFSAGRDNALTGNDLLNTADGALSSITDSLQRMRELSIQASNSTYTAEDVQSIQDEIEQLKQGIQDVAKGTSFNGISILDGSRSDLQLATNPNGSGMKIQLYNSTLDNLGIADYDVTKDFDIDDIDKALERVNSARSSLGSSSNALSHVSSYNSTASLANTASRSRLEDLDYGPAISEQKKNQVLQQYRFFAQKAQIQQFSTMRNFFF